MSTPDRISDGKVVRGEGSDKLQFRKTQMKKQITEDRCSLAGGLTRPHPGARPRVGACREAPGGWVFTHEARREAETWVRLLGPLCAERTIRVRCCMHWVTGQGRILAADETGYQNMDHHLWQEISQNLWKRQRKSDVMKHT